MLDQSRNMLVFVVPLDSTLLNRAWNPLIQKHHGHSNISTRASLNMASELVDQVSCSKGVTYGLGRDALQQEAGLLLF